MKYIASVSWGKDSTAMLLLIIEKGLPLDEVIFFDTGAEFEAIYKVRDKMVKEILIPKGIKYTELKRVSCWCCRNKNLKEIANYKKYLPKYYQMLCNLEDQIGEAMKPPYKLKERFKDYEK